MENYSSSLRVQDFTRIQKEIVWNETFYWNLKKNDFYMYGEHSCYDNTMWYDPLACLNSLYPSFEGVKALLKVKCYMFFHTLKKRNIILPSPLNYEYSKGILVLNICNGKIIVDNKLQINQIEFL